MSIPRHAKLSDHAAHRIEELTAEGVTVTYADAVMINAICWEMRGVGGDDCGLSRGRPVCVGNVMLWPLTVQALHALDAIDTDGMSDETQAYTLAYIMAHARTAGAFDGGISADNVTLWASQLTCTAGELASGIVEVNRQSAGYETESNAGAAKTDLADLVMTLQRLFGETAEYWEREVSASYATRLIMEEAVARSGKSGNPKTVMLTKALGNYINEMRRRNGNGKD
jgi:hypothetical protein